ncbi:MAG: PEP/pyruvate-binding domain-containing protein [Chloroflexota bacterium]|jgi:phosphohistidine swiveling domain-containing protein
MNYRADLSLVLPLDDSSATLETVGGKGASLARLAAVGLPVPPGFHITTEGYRLFVQASGIQQAIVEAAKVAKPGDPASVERASAAIRELFDGAAIPEEIASAIRQAYEQLDGGEAAVAVRSSATAEDLPEASFAGQQETYLNVRGEDALLDAVRRCWASLWTARAMAYRARQGIAPESVSLAVVVQRMVDAEAAGVLFTANPANGRRDQAVIDATWGLGEALVGGAVTPDHLVVDKGSGRVLSRETADKAMMTVPTENGTAEQPVPEKMRRQPVLDDRTAAELVRYGVRIETQFGAPQDIEWALADGQVIILQSRPITALPEPIGAVPTDWSVPDPTSYYYRASIIEQLPNPLSPLFATMAPEPIVQTLSDILKEVGFDFEAAIGFSTINGYGYIHMRIPVQFWVQMLTNIPAYVPIFKNATRRLREVYLPQYERPIEAWKTRTLKELPAAELLDGAREMLYRGVQFYTGVQTVIPLAVMSEVLFTEFYNRLVKRAGDPPAQTFLLGFDSLPIQAEKSLYDLAAWCREHPDLARLLIDTPSDRVSDLLTLEAPPDGLDDGVWREWQHRFQAHLDSYGHMLYDLDFVNPVPADEPAPLFETMKFYIRGEGIDPRERQRQAIERREEAIEAVRSRLDGVRWRIFHRLLRWAQDAAPERENALAGVGLGWPLLRRMLLELGRRLVAVGAISQADDVFWLELAEVEQAAAALDDGATRIDSHDAEVERRKMIWRGQKRATPPVSLPKGMRLGGIDMDRFMPARVEEQGGNIIKGIAVSAGRVTARARVLHGPEDFGQMRQGEVLVAGVTTPAWTPLFPLASAVVTDVGGPLSHSSIVAREYGIPAVLGTGVATKRIKSGELIRVDGDAGTVTLLERAAEAAETVSAASRRRWFTRSLVAIGAVVAALAILRYRRRR